jgi:hypothetical protein
MGERVPDGTTPSRSGPGDSALAEDYAALEAVLNATPRGRWFLAEYARRNRSAEAGMLLGAIAKLEAAVLEEQRQAALCGVFKELAEVSKVIARVRRDIAEIKPPHQLDEHFIGATEELDHRLVETLCFEKRINALIEMWAVEDLAFAVEDIAVKAEAPAEATFA